MPNRKNTTPEMKLNKYDEEIEKLTQKREKLKAEIHEKQDKKAGATIRRFAKRRGVSFDIAIAQIDGMESAESDLIEALREYEEIHGFTAESLKEKLVEDMKAEAQQNNGIPPR